MKLAIKTGDTVAIISGKDKGKTGKVIEVFPDENRVIVEGVNTVKKHQKPKSQQDKGGIITRLAPIDASNVMVICPICGKATRVSHTTIDGEKVRSCKKCKGSLDKKYVKQTKKDAKKTVKEEKTKAAPKAEAKKTEPKKAESTKSSQTTKKAPAKEASKSTKTSEKSTKKTASK